MTRIPSIRTKPIVIRLLFMVVAWASIGATVGGASEVLDVVSGVIASPEFKGKDPLQKLQLAGELVRKKKIKQTDVAFIVLDWSDQYLREPTKPLQRLQRWATLSSSEGLTHLRIPRDFLNRTLVAEYLVSETAYLNSPPRKKLHILEELSQKHLIDWSVSLGYERLYAGGIIAGSKSFEPTSPLEALNSLKNLQEQQLVGWHYRFPTEALLVAETLAMDPEYQKGSPYDRLLKLRNLERSGLIVSLTKKELESLPAWRLLINDPPFLRADPAEKRNRLSKLKDEGLISEATLASLARIFRPSLLELPAEEDAPTPIPEDRAPLLK